MARVSKTLTAPGFLAVAIFVSSLGAVAAGPLDEMALDRWAKLKEAERYQLNVAEKFYRENQFKVAADEYEKFLKLYEKSEGAPYAQLKWSHCQVQLRKLNAAVKDGYQSVLDYYPDAPEAPIAALLIGRTQRDTGDLKPAKKALAKTVAAYPKHFVAVMARLDLVEIAAKEMDLPTQSTLLRELTFDVDRKGANAQPCAEAAKQFTQLMLQTGNFEEALKAILTNCSELDAPTLLMQYHLGNIVHQQTGAMDEATRKLGEKLADASAAWFKIKAAEWLKDEKTTPRGVQTWLASAEIRFQARQPDKQKAVYEDMLATLGASDAVLGHLAKWYKDNKQMEQARLTYAKFKDAVDGQSHIAASYAEEKQFDKAIEIYNRIALAVDAKAAPKWLAAVAYTHRQAGKPDLAVAVYQGLIASDVANTNEYQFQMAETLYHAGRWKDSIARYRQVTDRPAHCLQHMAAANRNLKQYDEAIILYSQMPPSHASWALYQIAATHEEAGRKEEAIKVFKQVCDKFPKSTEGSQAHTHLNEKYKITVTLGGAKD